VGLCFAVVLKIFLVIFVRPIINIYRTDFHEICSIGKSLAVDEQSEVFFSIPQGTLPWQSILWTKSTSL